MRFLWVVLALMAVTTGCSKQESQADSAFTLAKGVSVTEITPCSNEPRRALAVKKDATAYFVTAVGEFSCEAGLKTPYLSLTKEKRATLVVGSSENKSSCECFRSVTVKLVDRLEAGDVLYVLNSGEVLGHSQLP